MIETPKIEHWINEFNAQVEIRKCKIGIQAILRAWNNEIIGFDVGGNVEDAIANLEASLPAL